MILEFHDHLSEPTRMEATRLVVRDVYHNPVALIIELGRGHVRVFHAGEPGFSEALASHGIQMTALVTRYDLKQLTS